MKHFFLYIFLFLGFAAHAQQPENSNKEQKIQALYIAYMSKELKLSEDEAQKFWPLHSEFDNELRGVSTNLSVLERQQTVLNIKKKYQDRFSRVLGTGRTNEFFLKDGEFRAKLVERLKAMRQQNQQNMRQKPNRRNN
jgi:GTP cyclohydrolase III